MMPQGPCAYLYHEDLEDILLSRTELCFKKTISGIVLPEFLLSLRYSLGKTDIKR